MANKRLDRGIWKTEYGYRVIVRIGDRLESKRFPPTYTLEALRRWRADHIRLRRPTKTARGTFAADVETYLTAVRAMPSYADRVREISAWLPAFGTRPRWRVRPDELRAQLATWRLTRAASTCNHRRTALSHLYTVLDGKSAPNPLRDIPPFPEPPATKRGLPLGDVLTAIRRVQGSQTRTRLLVLLWTGMRPSELMRVTPDDLDLRLKRCVVRTAKGGRPRELTLNRSAVKAWRRFVRIGAWGPFSVASVRKSLVRACRKDPPLPVFRVYDLRHSFLAAMRRAGADLADVQYTAGHSSMRLTSRYAPIVLDKAQRATDQMRKLPGKVSSRVTSAVNH